MVFVRPRPCAQGHPHLCARPRAVREADRQNLRASQKFSLARRLRDSFGVHSGEGEYEVVVRFNARAADYVREKKWHESQQLRELKVGSGIEDETFQLDGNRTLGFELGRGCGGCEARELLNPSREPPKKSFISPDWAALSAVRTECLSMDTT